MLDLNEKYVFNKKQQPVAVQMDLKTFQRLEKVLEDYALGQYMQDADSENLSLADAQAYYKKLPKKR